jgi:hypothetical protein
MSQALDPEMNLRFAWAVLILGYNQHDVAALFNVNGGRVAEAIRAVRLAIEDPNHVYDVVTQHNVGRSSP